MLYLAMAAKGIGGAAKESMVRAIPASIYPQSLEHPVCTRSHDLDGTLSLIKSSAPRWAFCLASGTQTFVCAFVLLDAFVNIKLFFCRCFFLSSFLVSHDLFFARPNSPDVL